MYSWVRRAEVKIVKNPMATVQFFAYIITYCGELQIILQVDQWIWKSVVEFSLTGEFFWWSPTGYALIITADRLQIDN